MPGVVKITNDFGEVIREVVFKDNYSLQKIKYGWQKMYGKKYREENVIEIRDRPKRSEKPEKTKKVSKASEEREWYIRNSDKQIEIEQSFEGNEMPEIKEEDLHPEVRWQLHPIEQPKYKKPKVDIAKGPPSRRGGKVAPKIHSYSPSGFHY